MNKKLLGNIFIVLLVIFVLSIVYIKFFSEDIIIKPFGIVIFQVQSNSMAPTFYKNDIIVIKEEKEYKVGDIVTYKTTKGNLITHRIIEKYENVFYTKGDNNNIKDEKEVLNEQIVGKAIFIIKTR